MHFWYVFAKINSSFEITIILNRDGNKNGFFIATIPRQTFIYCQPNFQQSENSAEVPRSHNSAKVLSNFENIWTTKSSCSRDVQIRLGFFSTLTEWISLVLVKTFWIEDDFSFTGSLYLVSLWTFTYNIVWTIWFGRPNNM